MECVKITYLKLHLCARGAESRFDGGTEDALAAGAVLGGALDH